jgi:hypothetical protein
MLREHAARAAARTQTDPTVAAVINRLSAEFLEQAGPLTIVRVVLQARHDLDEPVACQNWRAARVTWSFVPLRRLGGIR